MLDTPALTAFVTVVDSGSAHAAARRLGLSQAALSRRLQRLEASLGIKLFVRAGRGLALSEQGSQLLPKVRAHLEGLSSVLKSVRDTVRYGVPTVTLGCLPTLCTSVLPQALAAVNKRHPDIRLRIHDLSATEIRQNIADGSADVAITYLGIEERGFSQQAIIEEPMVLVVAKGHDLARQTHLPWRALSGLDLIGRPGLKSAEHDWSDLEGLDPNLAVVMPCGYDADEAATQAHEYIERIRSTGAERIVAVDAAASFSRPGPRLIDGIELLAGLLHPDAALEEGKIEHRELDAGERLRG